MNRKYTSCIPASQNPRSISHWWDKLKVCAIKLNLNLNQSQVQMRPLGWINRSSSSWSEELRWGSPFLKRANRSTINGNHIQNGKQKRQIVLLVYPFWNPVNQVPFEKKNISPLGSSSVPWKCPLPSLNFSSNPSTVSFLLKKKSLSTAMILNFPLGHRKLWSQGHFTHFNWSSQSKLVALILEYLTKIM